MSLQALLASLLSLTLPLWLLAGFGDWLCHRRSRIEQTSGPRESALHLLLYLLVAVPVALGLWLEISASMLLVMTAGVAAHMGVSLWDTSFAQPRRHISPLEQQIHSYLEMVPLFALALVFVLHWDAVQHAAWTWSLRERPLPEAWRWGVIAALMPGMVMIIEELLRCLRGRTRLTDLPQ